MATTSGSPVSSSSAAATGGPVNNGATTSSSSSSASMIVASSRNNMNNAIWDMQGTVLQGFVQQQAPHPDPTVAVALWKNLQTSLRSLQETVRKETVEPPDTTTNEKQVEEENAAPKKSKKRKKTRVIRTVHDPYRIWLQAWKTKQENGSNNSNDDAAVVVLAPEADDLPATDGGKLAQLTVDGIFNALAAVPGGLSSEQKVLDSKDDAPLKTAANQTPSALKDMATVLYRAVQKRVRSDILRTTPIRIQEYLAADLTPTEFASIRKRVYDTVVLGKGVQQQNADDDDDDDPDGPTTSRSSAVHDIEKFHKCKQCGNNDQSSFVLDRKNGDVICSNCGTIVSESIMHEGSQYRKFEGEADRNHHGDRANPLYSNSHNMGTTLGGVSQVTGAGMGGWRSGGSDGGGSGRKRNIETILRNAHAYTELNVSQFGKTDRRTRIGYKDKQKKDAFMQMAHVGDALNLHEAVVQRAKELFAGFRDDRELVQQFKGVIAACLCEAFDQLSKKGQAILKQDEQAEAKKPQAQQAGPISARAARRNEMHHANLAGKGGLLLDYAAVEKEKAAAASAETASSNSAATSPKASEKPAAAWDLLDCRSWLLDASRRIAQHWVDERSKLEGAAAKKIPAGSLEELEGRLVEHSITLCEHLETELRSRNKTEAAAAGKRVITPRVNDMSKLGIKWQHSNERGSGGKGGVGGSGNKKVSGAGISRTAGQILILKTAKKLGMILNDPVAGEAFHKELRAVIAQQETRKRQLQREEATRQRLLQMKRKPWLQARVQA